MKKRFFPSAAMVFLYMIITLNVLPVFAQHNQGVNFLQDIPFQSAIDKANGLNKGIMLFVISQNCDPCNMMKESVFSSPEIAKKVNDSFISVSVYISDSQYELVFTKHNVSAAPTVLFLDKNGSLLKDQRGGIAYSAFLDLLNEVNNQSMVHKTSVQEQRLEYGDSRFDVPQKTAKKSAFDNHWINNTPKENPIKVVISQPKKFEGNNNLSNNLNKAQLNDLYQSGLMKTPEYIQFLSLLDKNSAEYNAVTKSFIDNLSNKDAKQTVVRDFIYEQLMSNLQEDAMSFIQDHISYYETKPGFYKNLLHNIHTNFLLAIQSKNQGRFDYVDAISEFFTIERHFPDYKYEIRCDFNAALNNWDAYIQEVEAFMSDNRTNKAAKKLNEFASKLAIQANQHHHLIKALDWTNISINMNADWYNYYTTAIILFRLGEKENALSACKKSLQIAERKGVNNAPIVNLYNDILTK